MPSPKFPLHSTVRILGTLEALRPIAGAYGVIVGFAPDAPEMEYGVLVEADDWYCWQIPESQLAPADRVLTPPA